MFLYFPIVFGDFPRAWCPVAVEDDDPRVSSPAIYGRRMISQIVAMVLFQLWPPKTVIFMGLFHDIFHLGYI